MLWLGKRRSAVQIWRLLRVGVRTYSLSFPGKWALPGTFGGSAHEWFCAFIVVIGAVLFCSEMREVVLDGSQTPDLRLILDGIKDFIGELEQSELLYQLIGSKKAQWEDQKRLSLIGRLPPVWILSMGGGFMWKLWLFSVVTRLHEGWRKYPLPPPNGCRV